MPRKTESEIQTLVERVVASMRPRPDAAENRFDYGARAILDAGFNEAAARCRGKRPTRAALLASAWASMRPRPDAAENAGGSGRKATPSRCFNEAAARCRGKLQRFGRNGWEDVALQ